MTPVQFERDELKGYSGNSFEKCLVIPVLYFFKVIHYLNLKRQRTSAEFILLAELSYPPVEKSLLLDTNELISVEDQ